MTVQSGIYPRPESGSALPGTHKRVEQRRSSHIVKKGVLNMRDVYQKLIGQIKGKTIDHILANKDANDGFDICFTDGTSLELYVIKNELGMVFNES